MAGNQLICLKAQIHKILVQKDNFTLKTFYCVEKNSVKYTPII